MEIIVKNENDIYNVSVSLPNTTFNKEISKRLFQIYIVNKNVINAGSSFKNIVDVTKLIEKWFNLNKIINI